MKQRINLYQLALQPQRQTMALPSLFALLALVLVISLLGWGFGVQNFSVFRFKFASLTLSHFLKDIF